MDHMQGFIELTQHWLGQVFIKHSAAHSDMRGNAEDPSMALESFVHNHAIYGCVSGAKQDKGKSVMNVMRETHMWDVNGMVSVVDSGASWDNLQGLMQEVEYPSPIAGLHMSPAIEIVTTEGVVQPHHYSSYARVYGSSVVRASVLNTALVAGIRRPW